MHRAVLAFSAFTLAALVAGMGLLPNRKGVSSATMQDRWAAFQDVVVNSAPEWGDWCAVADTGDPDALEMLTSCPSPSTDGAFNLTGAQVARLFKHRLIHDLGIPRQLIRVRGHDLNGGSARPSVLAEVIFNPTAEREIRDRILCCNSQDFSRGVANILSEMGSQGKPQPLEMESFPPGSIVLKTTWAVTSADIDTSRIGIKVEQWQPDTLEETKQPVQIVMPVTSNPGFGKPPNAAYVGTVPLNCFYYVRVDASDFTGSEAIKFKRYTSGPPPYYFILLGFHVLVKGQSGWTWNTYWWDLHTFDKANDGWKQSHQAGNPLVNDSRWAHYVADSIGPEDASTNIYNPYLEGEFNHGATSNCIACHSFARFHPTVNVASGQKSPDCYFNNEFALATGTSLEPASDCPAIDPTTLPKLGLGTDRLWSLADSDVQSLHTAPQVNVPDANSTHRPPK